MTPVLVASSRVTNCMMESFRHERLKKGGPGPDSWPVPAEEFNKAFYAFVTTKAGNLDDHWTGLVGWTEGFPKKEVCAGRMMAENAPAFKAFCSTQLRELCTSAALGVSRGHAI